MLSITTEERVSLQDDSGGAVEAGEVAGFGGDEAGWA
jgi:hypothetical protein